MGLCEMHYIRRYRTGSLVKPVGHFNPALSGKYLVCLGEKVHRMVYRATNPEPKPCWNCGKELSWDMGKSMHIDHIDNDTTNNHISNLRASCITCNTRRPKREANAV